MNRTHRHLLYALVWLLAFTTVVAIIAATSTGELNPGMAQSVAQIGSAIWVLGFGAIFYSWAKVDATEHGRSSRTALLFAIVWPFSFPISHPAYLLFTRGGWNGLLSVLKLICFLLAAGIVWFAFSRLLGTVL